MIQRIQTVYLLGAITLVVLCFFIPVVEFTSATGQIDKYTLNGLTNSVAGNFLSKILTFLSGVAVGVNFTAIFFYKKRKQQMRACLFVIVLLVIISALVFFQISHLKRELNMTVAYKLPIAFPLISAVFTYLAYLGIKKDEELVRSYDRLR